ncbi:hypothetical protein A0J61_03709 [Choanephora cucurbitarum]|uniref:Uncharacterized protein n=1 Tax=Choanephora cucurbitarum TaxID=101091 RepID=A0A1C7NGK8_9FUNG|nr:hypothetical protein A0J61_03709 [Choanephora cucurbitarum]
MLAIHCQFAIEPTQIKIELSSNGEYDKEWVKALSSMATHGQCAVDIIFRPNHLISYELLHSVTAET